MQYNPFQDRVVTDCPPIAFRPLPTSILFPEGSDGTPDCDILLEHLKREGLLNREDMMRVIKSAHDVMMREPNVVRLDDPVTVVGDLHGQFYDFVEVLKLTDAQPPDRSFLFLGDYVDRGSFSVEIMTYLYCLKLVHPRHVILLRGNHESKQMSEFFNFKDECLHKYDEGVYDAFIESFTALPIAAIVNGKYFCLHGGISPDLTSVSQLYTFDRFTEPGPSGLFCDLLWADPAEESDSVSRGKTEPFRPNEARGCSYYYSHEAACEFLKSNNLSSIIRAHEVQVDGYKMEAIYADSGLPSTITVFSAPNYCDIYGNKGSIIHIIDDTLDVVQFGASTHPFTLPNFMSVFEWSVPFVAEKVSELLHAVVAEQNETPISPSSKQLVHTDAAQLVEQLQHKIEHDVHSAQTMHRLKAKVRTIGRMLSVMRRVRQQREGQLKEGIRVHSAPELLVTESSDEDTQPIADERGAASPRRGGRRSSFTKALESDFLVEKRRPAS